MELFKSIAFNVYVENKTASKLMSYVSSLYEGRKRTMEYNKMKKKQVNIRMEYHEIGKKI